MEPMLTVAKTVHAWHHYQNSPSRHGKAMEVSLSQICTNDQTAGHVLRTLDIESLNDSEQDMWLISFQDKGLKAKEHWIFGNTTELFR